ncbi:MAG: bifunctional aspartate kinase/homoserine dehydrogenase I [Bacteroidetes bacterium]|nr:bifunctional aspartate kinase/homoserine dehydrogenase I [Bacteroidota bacterium]
MIVLKFGGSSVATAERIKGVAKIIEQQYRAEKKLAVVFSAFGGVTDDLIKVSQLAATQDNSYLDLFQKIKQRHLKTANELGLKQEKALYEFMEMRFAALQDLLHGVFLVKELSQRTLDFVCSHGELFAAKIIAHYFTSQKLKSTFLDASLLVKTDENFGSAKVDFLKSNKNIRAYFASSKSIEVVTGFIGSTSKNEITTLGRGGSDYTAAIFGAALQASEIQIWTDVDGVMTADPRKVRKAFSVGAMTYEEAMEMSHFGAKVIHPPTIQPALEKGIPLWIKNTFNPSAHGTLISTKSSDPNYMVKGISSIDGIALLTLQGSGMVGVAGISARLFGALSQAKVNVILITQGSSEHTISFAVKPGDAEIARKAIEETFALEIKVHLIEKVRVEENLSIVAVIGENMRNTPGVSGRLFQALGKNGISVVATAQGSSELNISVVIHAKDLNKALNTLHQGFFLSDVKTLNVFLVGSTGLIGSTLIKQIEKQKKFLREARSIELIIAGITNTQKMYFDEDGISLSRYKEVLETKGEKSNIKSFVQRIKELNLAQSIFVDCTSSAEVVSHYNEILESSVSIVTPNKLANSGKYTEYTKLRSAAKKRGVRFLYETNVGAGLPVISTLSDLLHSGDKIIRIEAVLSGTLSYIFNSYKKGIQFNEVVLQAKEKGYTEPDPRDDLSGMDVARKLLILARETGMEIEIKDIAIEQILPPNCVKAKSVTDFFKELEISNAVFEARRAKAEEKGKVLRFIALLENGKASIRLLEVDEKHPFYNLSGSDNIISFTTERYHDRPLVVKGPGAGAEVTAAGVFAEIISIGNYFE